MPQLQHLGCFPIVNNAERNMGVHIPLQITIFIYFEYTSRSRIAMLVTQSCLTLCEPMDCSMPGSSVRGTFQARILEWVASLLQGIFLTQELELGLLHWRQILYHLSYWEAHLCSRVWN